MEQKFDYGTIDEILKNHDYSETMIVTILQEVQAHFGYLPKEAFPYLAQELKVSEAMLYGVATFYENFSLEPKGKCVIRVCDGTPFHRRAQIPPRGTEPPRGQNDHRRWSLHR